jgi:hypothetical protein
VKEEESNAEERRGGVREFVGEQNKAEDAVDRDPSKAG